MLIAYLTIIANTLRTFLDTNEKINAKDFPENIYNVHRIGIRRGREIGIPEGEQAEYNKFWDNFQDNGNRTHYSHGFAGRGWNDEIFKPKYDIIAIESERLFAYSQITDLKGILERQNVKLDTSQATYLQQPFMYSTITDIPELDLRKHTSVGYLLSNGTKIVNVDKVILKDDGSQTLNNFATNCTSLKEIRFEGAIGKDLQLQWSPLSIESMKDTIAHLKDFSGTNETHTVTFKKDRETMLTAEEKAVATNKGWTLVWS